ncbi:tetratricopeptide repeat protein [Sphingomicrobium lutaoense]|uniref:Cytochrome c-type biogenesis protein CcmH/NrfG n=1 Tax=Sphingomicrobium lutaoense TaxID=515949 RepID=A0A839YTI3_9SPHN|nr:cytochrome C biosynthesis protein [Sphingomicrobium lutaoense]MBB3763581.1 cytochrome c-type biogenesis protein CcmH/NrfG [Sphingomicrobium lutaoense]
MTGFLILLTVAAIVLGLLWLMKVRGNALTMVAAALAFAGAGYALEGRPSLGGDPRTASDQARPPMPLTGARHAFFGRFNSTDQWAIISESYASRGDTEKAAGILGSAVRDSPRNFALWTLYGNALTDHGGGINPAARLAFARAEALAPEHPGPRFFRALAQARSGEVEEALATWRALQLETPERAGYYPLIVQGIATFSSDAPADQNSGS